MSQVDVHVLSSGERSLSAVGRNAWPAGDKTGAVTAVALSEAALAIAYEDGRVALFSQRTLLWSRKSHAEPVMGLAWASDVVWSVAADSLVVAESTVFKTSQAGKSAIAVRADGKLVLTAGWDGVARIYSARTFKPLAVLQYHRDGLHAAIFGPMVATAGKDGRIALWDVYAS